MERKEVRPKRWNLKAISSPLSFTTMKMSLSLPTPIWRPDDDKTIQEDQFQKMSKHKERTDASDGTTLDHRLKHQIVVAGISQSVTVVYGDNVFHKGEVHDKRRSAVQGLLWW